MQCDNSKHKNEDQCYHNEKGIESTINSGWGKKIEEQGWEQNGCHVANKWDHK